MCVCVCVRARSLAYERALAIASGEKEKAYILTALALLQHRLGGLDSAKTLLFKWSVVCRSGAPTPLSYKGGVLCSGLPMLIFFILTAAKHSKSKPC